MTLTARERLRIVIHTVRLEMPSSYADFISFQKWRDEGKSTSIAPGEWHVGCYAGNLVLDVEGTYQESMFALPEVL